MLSAEVDKHIWNLRAAVEDVFAHHKNDPRAILLMQTLLYQINIVKTHFDLMTAEEGGIFLLSEQEFKEIMAPYLSLNREIRRVVTRAPNSLYETGPINGVYEMLSHHFRENGER